MEAYTEDNKRYLTWFEKFTEGLTNIFPEFNERIVLTGSRSFGLAYPESDLEFAIITPTDEQEETFQKISDYFKLTHEVKETKTKAGLYLLTIHKFETNPNVWKLEITLRTKEQQELISNHINKTLSSWTEEQKLDYINNIRNDYLNSNEESYNQRKSWLRVLPQK